MRKQLIASLAAVALLLASVPAARAQSADTHVSYFGNQAAVFSGISTSNFAGATGKVYIFAIQPQNSIAFYLSNSSGASVTLDYSLYTTGSPNTADYSNNTGLWSIAASYDPANGYVPLGQSQAVTVSASSVIKIQSPISSGSQIALQLNQASVSTQFLSLSAVFTPGGTIPIPAQPVTVQGQPTTYLFQTSAANTANVLTKNSNGTQSPYLWSLEAFCNAGTAQLTVAQGGTLQTLWQTPAGAIGTGLFTATWTSPLQAGGQKLTVTLSSCGSGNTSTLAIQTAVY